MNDMGFSRLLAVVLLLPLHPALAQTRVDTHAINNALALGYQASADALAAQRGAQARAAIAEAERDALLARLPPASSKAPAGEMDVSRFGAAGLVKAFDLARELAPEVCGALPAGSGTVIHDPLSTQGVVTARIVNDGIAQMSLGLEQQARQLQEVIDRHGPAGTRAAPLSALGLAVVPAVVRSLADISALARTDVIAQGIAYGSGARDLFTTALAQSCPDKLAGLGSGYLGELDPAQHEQLVTRVRALMLLRGQNAGRVAVIERLADAAKGELKRELGRVADGAQELLKAADAFVESLKVGEASDRSPLYNAARYLGYANRARTALVLDFDLRLEGLTLVRDRLFTGQKLHLSGVAFLWYRLHEPDGTVRLAKAARRITKPVEVDLRGEAAPADFWTGTADTAARR
jgi:hypothetical protein